MISVTSTQIVQILHCIRCTVVEIKVETRGGGVGFIPSCYTGPQCITTHTARREGGGGVQTERGRGQAVCEEVEVRGGRRKRRRLGALHGLNRSSRWALSVWTFAFVQHTCPVFCFCGGNLLHTSPADRRRRGGRGGHEEEEQEKEWRKRSERRRRYERRRKSQNKEARMRRRRRRGRKREEQRTGVRMKGNEVR